MLFGQQIENQPIIFDEPPRVADLEISFKSVENPFLPDHLAQTIVLEINKSVFPAKVNPRDYLSTSYGIQSDHAEIIALAKEITSKHRDDYSKVKAVHDWLATNIYYDLEAYFSNRRAYSFISMDVLKNKRGVCQGYANLSAALLRSVGIPCRVVTGLGLGMSTNGKWDAQNLEKRINHAWNEVYVSGRWIIMDVTWDCDMTYINGNYYTGMGLKHQYFDPTIDSFSLSHRIEPENPDGVLRMERIKEDHIWNHIAGKNTLDFYRYYLQHYPNGRYYDQCMANMRRQLMNVYGRR